MIGPKSYFFMPMLYFGSLKTSYFDDKNVTDFLTNFQIFASITNLQKKKKYAVSFAIMTCILTNLLKLYASDKIKIKRNSVSFCAKSLSLLIKHKFIIFKNFRDI